MKRCLLPLILLTGCHAVVPVAQPVVCPPAISITPLTPAQQVECSAEAGYNQFNPASKTTWKKLSNADKQQWRDWVVAMNEWRSAQQ